jgi:NAD(P)-dependent dehydrogenase (short-subunit alcohol dehydrogenase family)
MCALSSATASDPCRYGIITGAASGIGREIAKQLAGPAWQLLLLDVDAAGLQATAAAVESAGGAAHWEAFDVADSAAWHDLHARWAQDWPRLDLLCNNAGVCGAGEVGRFGLADWTWLLNINLLGPIYACHELIGWMKENPHGGAILNTASLAGLIAIPGMAAYNVSKAGMVALSETMQAELAPYNIRVSVLCPGFCPTGLVAKGRFENEDLRASAEQFMQHGQVTAADVAAAGLKAVRRGKLYAVLGWKARWLWRVKRFAPRPFAALVRWAHRRQSRRSAKALNEPQPALSK